jgi:hypothetical protein
MSEKDRLRAILIDPIISNKPEYINERDYLEYTMCINTRPIATYRVVYGPVEMPGIYLENGVHPNPKAQVQRTLKNKDKVVVRRDEVLMRIDAEANGRVFRLSQNEFERLRRALQPIRNNHEADKDVR